MFRRIIPNGKCDEERSANERRKWELFSEHLQALVGMARGASEKRCHRVHEEELSCGLDLCRFCFTIPRRIIW